jgi:L-rhamnose mutarotase
MDKDLGYYEKIIDRLHVKDEQKRKEVLEYALNYLKENIVYCYSNTHSVSAVLTELFKRGLAKKWTIDHQTQPI